MELNRVGVLGAGLMGHGIAQICAQAGWDVVLREVDQGRLDGGVAKIEKQLARAVEKGKAEQADADAVRARIAPTLDYADLADCDLVIEAITEDLDMKLVMPLLEVVRAEGTADDAYDFGFAVGEKLRKTTVAAGDNRGFIVNRLLVPYMLDAIRAYEQGVGSVDDIDTGMKAGASHPMGPLTLADFVGLDTLASIAGVMYEAYGEERFSAPATLTKMVGAGEYGRKSSRGFYDYSGDAPVATDPAV
jgi:3-hydroxybutyryl-CoA dehydrogenase